MSELFIKLFNMSITAGWIVVAVLLLRLLFKKAPKAFSVLLWAFVGIRLLFPFSFESIFSIIPSSQTLPDEIIYSDAPTIDSGIPIINSAVNPFISQSLAPNAYDSVNPLQVITEVAAYIWLIGIAVMLIYAFISYFKIARSVREALMLNDNVYICDRIDTPFILGIFKPRIYLPSYIDESDKTYVTAHEAAHIKRRDHWWKPLGYLLLTVYWFNPMMWLAYILLCRDIELATDEKVISDMGIEIKKEYSDALINCSVNRKSISACPLAFGENGVKSRVKAVLHYKKPAFWVIIVAVIISLCAAVCLLTDPEDEISHGTVSDSGEALGDGGEARVEYYGTVIEVKDTYVYIEPFEFRDKSTGPDRVFVSINGDLSIDAENIKIGDELKIICDGAMREIYPPEINKVYDIELYRSHEESELPAQTDPYSFVGRVVRFGAFGPVVKPLSVSSAPSISSYDYEIEFDEDVNIGELLWIKHDGNIWKTDPPYLNKYTVERYEHKPEHQFHKAEYINEIREDGTLCHKRYKYCSECSYTEFGGLFECYYRNEICAGGCVDRFFNVKVLIESGDNYRYYRNGAFYSYVICDDSGNIVLEEELNVPISFRTVGTVKNALLCVSKGSGASVYTTKTYYSRYNNTISKEYCFVVADSEKYIAYLDGETGYKKLVVRDIFDENGYYKEFSFDFNYYDTPVVNAYFFSGGKKLTVTYYSQDENKLKTQTVDI